MKTAMVFTYKLFLCALAATALFSLVLLSPETTSAQTVSSQTAQILPPGANNCAPIQISAVAPYIYDGALNSFEFTVSDPSYVAVIGSVGNTSIPLRYMVRRTDASGGVRYHIDTDATSVAGSLPITVTLLSARSGAPVCASVIGFNVGTGTIAPSSSSSGTGAPQTPATPKPQPAAPAQPATPTPATSSTTTAPSTGTSTVAPVASGIQNPLRNLCVSDASAYRLWLVLLVIYALVVGGLLWLEFPVAWNWAKTPERVASAVLVLLVLLLAFWYLSTSCRAALWMPLLAFVIAALGLLAAFWNHPKVSQLLLVEQKKSVIVTPPPTKK